MGKNLQNSFNVKKKIKSKQQQQNLDNIKRKQIHPKKHHRSPVIGANERKNLTSRISILPSNNPDQPILPRTRRNPQVPLGAYALHTPYTYHKSQPNRNNKKKFQPRLKTMDKRKKSR